jgi:DNA-binding Lrp family transcriptional regulator
MSWRVPPATDPDWFAVKRLAEILGVGPSAVTPLVDKLVEHGYVSRHEDAVDRRILRVRPTPAGVALLEQLNTSQLDELAQVVERSASDLLLVPGAPPSVRIDGQVVPPRDPGHGALGADLPRDLCDEDVQRSEEALVVEDRRTQRRLEHPLLVVASTALGEPRDQPVQPVAVTDPELGRRPPEQLVAPPPDEGAEPVADVDERRVAHPCDRDRLLGLGQAGGKRFRR